MNNITDFKIVLVGDAKVGKTSLLYKLLYPDASLDSILNEFNSPEYEDFIIKDVDIPNNYCPTLGVSVHPITFLTNYGTYRLTIWDCAGQEKYKGLRDGYFIQTHGAIIMGDYTNTIRDFNKYKIDVFRVRHCPYVNVLNKSDLSDSHLNSSVHIISVLKSQNLLAPFQDLLSQLTNKPDLVITQNVS